MMIGSVGNRTRDKKEFSDPDVNRYIRGMISDLWQSAGVPTIGLNTCAIWIHYICEIEATFEEAAEALDYVTATRRGRDSPAIHQVIDRINSCRMFGDMKTWQERVKTWE